MSLMVISFLLVLVLSFVCLLLLTRPSPVEKVIDSRLSQIHVTQDVYLGQGAPAIFKQTKLSDAAWVDAFLQRIPATHAIQNLLTQADSSWSVGQVIVFSMVTAIAGGLICLMFLPIRMMAIAAGLGAAALPLVFLRGKRERRLK